MSFSVKVKSELCRNQMNHSCCCKAESMGILLYCNIFTPNEIRIITENAELCQRLPKLFQKAFNVEFDQLPNEAEGNKFVLRILDKVKIGTIINSLGFDAKQFVTPHLNLGLLEEDCCKASFLRGAFLSGGSVTDPEKRYHLEFANSHFQASKEVASLLIEMGFEAGEILRGSYHVLYYKHSESIEDVLTTIGAPVSSMDIMTAKVDKEIRNGANRAMNCDMANVNKTLDAAREQVEAIELLKKNGKFDLLPDNLKETANMRLLNPELSLSDLAMLYNPPLSKSCINHRFRKIIELSRK